MHRTQVHIPTPFRHVVSVADAASRLRLLAANFTLLCHDNSRWTQILIGKHIFYGNLSISRKHAAIARGLSIRYSVSCTIGYDEDRLVE
jgi:hypothetical protein